LFNRPHIYDCNDIYGEGECVVTGCRDHLVFPQSTKLFAVSSSRCPYRFYSSHGYVLRPYAKMVCIRSPFFNRRCISQFATASRTMHVMRNDHHALPVARNVAVLPGATPGYNGLCNIQSTWNHGAIE